MNITKDQKPQAQPNPYAKSSVQPFGAAKGLPKANPTQSTMPFASGAAKTQETAQTAARPQYNYFHPPTGHVKTQVTPYNYFKPLYDKYPGGYDKAIADSQRWQEHAKLEGLQTWKPEDLHNPVEVRGGNFVGPWESRQAPLLAAPRGFTSPTDPMRAGAYATSNANFNFPLARGSVMINPDYADRKLPDGYSSNTMGHELTHIMHRGSTRLNDGVFKGYEDKFPEHLSRRGSAGVGTRDDPRSTLDYTGTPTEFGAYLSELRRHWIQNNPGKALNSVPAAEALLQHYNPARDVQPARDFSMMVPDNAISYDSAYPRSFANRGDVIKSLSPRERAQENRDAQRFYNQDQQAFQARKASGVPDGQREIRMQQPADSPVPTVRSYFQPLLPTIMSDPKLKQKAILQILSSVVQNKQRQAPGTNV